MSAVAANQAWVEPVAAAGDPVSAEIAAGAADASAPLVSALALVALAGWGVVLVTRGRFRRAIGFLLGAAGLLLLVVTVTAFVQAPTALAEQYDVGSADRTAWSWVALPAAVLATVGALLAARDAGGWPGMGSRYDAPAAGDGQAGPAGPGESDLPPEERSNLDLWKSLDEGSDPTR